MIRLNDELRDALAAEYVLGTQSRLVRKRMERLIDQDAALAARVEWWHRELAPMNNALDPVPVPPWIWRRIENKLRPEDTTAEVRGGWWGNLMVWRWSTGLAAALALVLAITPPSEPQPTTMTADGGVVLVLTDEESRSAWLVSRKSDSDPLKAQALALPVLTMEQAYELWLLPPNESPRSLGLLNDSGSTILQPGSDLSQLLEPGLSMAVSVEPPGGSPTGTPTGPVLFTGAILEL